MKGTWGRMIMLKKAVVVLLVLALLTVAAPLVPGAENLSAGGSVSAEDLQNAMERIAYGHGVGRIGIVRVPAS